MNLVKSGTIIFGGHQGKRDVAPAQISIYCVRICAIIGAGGGILGMQASEIWSHIGSFVAGALGGSLLTFRLTRTNKASGSGRVVDQSKSWVGGDQTGGDKIQR